MSLAKPLHLRLFLEGVEVPVISAVVSANLDAPASAAIQIVPIDEGTAFKPRTMVHLFFLEEPLVKYTAGKREDLSGSSLSELGDDAYKLLFTGEICGFTMQRTPTGRALVLQCLDFSSYWDALKLTMLDYGPQGNAFVQKGALEAANSYLFSNVPTQSPEEQLRGWITGHPKTPGLEDVKGLAAGILNTIEKVGGLAGHSLGVNDFFTIAELRCKLMAQVTCDEQDSTSQRLLSETVFWKWIFNEIQTGGGQYTLRDILKILCNFIYYNFVPNPVAKYEVDGTQKQVTTPERRQSLSSMTSVTQARASMESAATDFVQASNNFNADNVVSKMQTAVDKLKATGRSSTFTQTLNNLDAAIKLAKVPNIDEARAKLNAALSTMAAESKKTVVISASKEVTIQRQSRLKSQVFRPDCFMSAPPVCNVVFPEQYSNFSYDRNFINEVTRAAVLYHSTVAGKDELTAQTILAPTLTGDSKNVAKYLKNQHRILMDHELHTGIVSVIEWLPDSMMGMRDQRRSSEAATLRGSTINWQKMTAMHHFFKYRIGPRHTSVSGRFMPYLVAGFPGLVIQRPFYVQGMEDSDDAQMLSRVQNSTLLDADMPQQILGTIDGFSHEISQEGGRTSFSMSHCRMHNGIDDEFIGAVMAETTAKESKTRVRYRLQLSEVSENERLVRFMGDLTPQDDAPPAAVVSEKTSMQSAVSYSIRSKDGSGSTQTVTTVVGTKSESEIASSSSPYTQVIDALWSEKKTLRVPKGKTTKGKGAKGLHDGSIFAVEVIDDSFSYVNGRRVFAALVVYEDIVVPATEVPVPVEDIVRPAWLSTSYDNDQIGTAVYQPFFGCDSIIDDVEVYDENGNKVSALSVEQRPPEDGVEVNADDELRKLQDDLLAMRKRRSLLSIEKAVNTLSYVYGHVRSKKLDVDEFITSYTRRPIASKKDMLGSHDLELTVDGDVVKKRGEMGTVGFHTMSVHEVPVDAGKLVGLLDSPTTPLDSMTSGQQAAVQADYDVRKAKLDRVRQYVNRLQNSRAFQG